MSEHDFGALFDGYRRVIDQMPAVFTSHQFILRLAQQNQALYVDALYSYRHVPAPFRTVHGMLARHLNAHKNLEKLGKVASTDIFGQPNECEQWKKVSG